MSLRARIFLLGSGILLLLLAAEWWLVESLRQRFRSESAAIAQEVGVAVMQDNDWLRWADAMRAVEMAQRANKQLDRQDAARAQASNATQWARHALPMVPAVKIPGTTERLDAMTRDFQIDMLVGSLVILLAGIAALAFVAHRVSKPLQSLGRAAAAVEAGRLGAQAEPCGEAHFDAAIAAFNSMSSRLAVLEASARDAQERTHLTELGEIARGIAHSLRNPLHALGLSVAELAAAPANAAQRAELAGTCRLQIENIDRTLRSFLSLAAANSQTPAPVDLVDLIQDVVMEAAMTAAGRVHIECELGADRPRVLGIAAELRTALHVLVVNAVEASDAGGSITVRINSEADAVCVVVEDDGPGLSASVRARLFHPHVTTKAQGAGLGLFLAERIARRRYGGSLELADRAGHGLRAVLTLRDTVAHA
jgi:signal transduction histidine kinase